MGMREAEAPFRRSGGLTIHPDIAIMSLQHCRGEEKAHATTCILRTADILSHAPSYCFASGAASTWRQAAGSCANVIGGFGFAGRFGGLG